MFFCATSGFQPSVYSSPTILMSPFFTASATHLLLAGAQEVGVRVGGRALDDHVVALGLRPCSTARACMRPTSTLSKVM